MKTHPASTPVLVGIGTASRREEDWRQALEPLDLMFEAVQRAGADTGASGTLAGLQYISVPRGRWSYANPGADLARRIGAAQATSALATPGVLQQTLVGEACARIARGEIHTALVTGADAGYRLLRAQIAGDEAPERATAGAPDLLMQPKDELRHPVERRAGLKMPVALYAILESAYRARHGWSVENHRDRLADLYTNLSRIAVENPHAWNRSIVARDDIRDASPRNPMQAFPYTRFHCSTWNVDQAAALLLCSTAQAEALGISRSRWVYPVVSTESNHMVAVSARDNLSDCPGARVTGQAALAAAGLSIDEIDLLELYSCFPVAIELYARAIDAPLTRDLSVTGGMSFAGGPYNNYFLQATCRAVELMREGKGANALLSCVSGIVTKQAFGIWSMHAPARSFAHLDLTDAVAGETVERDVVDSFTGRATVAGYTVLHGRGQVPKGVALVDLDDRKRALVTTEDPSLTAQMQTRELVGKTARVNADTLVALA